MYTERPEEWRDIPGFPTYMVSDYGRVMNWRTNRILKTSISGNGVQIHVRHGRAVYTKRLARLVVEAFYDEILTERWRVEHRNGDFTDNRYDNLLVLCY